MEESKTNKKWFKKLGIAFGFLLLVLVAVYLVATSAWCLKSVILPRVSKAAGATITVEEASVSPFSSVSLTGLKVQTPGMEPLFSAKHLLARYSLMAILRGNSKVDEVTVSDPVVRVVINADGTSNLDPFTKRKAAEKKPKPAKPGEVLVDVKKFAIENAQMSFTQFQKDGSRLAVEVTGLNFAASDIKNGQTAKLSLGSGLKVGSGAATNLAHLEASLKGAFSAELGSDLRPKQVKGEMDLAVTSATGAFADATELGARFTADFGMTEIKQMAFNFSKANAALGAVSVSGPLDLAKQEGRLKISAKGLGNQVLSLVGGRYGISFGSTKLAADYDVELKNQGRLVNTTGSIKGDQFSLTRGTLTTPVLDFQLGYSLTIDLGKTNASVRSFTFNTTQAGRSLLKAGLSKEMTLDWSKGSQAVAESALTLEINELNLTDWKALFGTNITSGTVNGKLTVNVQKAGNLMGYDLTAVLSNLAAQFGSNRIAEAQVELGLRGQVADFAKVNLTEHTLLIKHAGQPILSGRSSGQVDASTMDLDLLTSWDLSLPRLSELLARPDLVLNTGALKFAGHVTQTNQTPNQPKNPVIERNVAGNLQLTNLTGRFQSNRFDRFETVADVQVEVKNDVARIKKCGGRLQQAGLPGGGFEVTGSLNLATQAGEIGLKLTDLNQNILQSVTAALAPMKLASISVNANGSAKFDAQGGCSVKASLNVTNLVVSDPAGTMPKTPLAAAVQWDVAMLKSVLDMRLCKLMLTPTARAKNELTLAGKVDMTKSNATSGLMKLTSESLDFTPYYEMFVTDKKTATPAAGGRAGAGPESEPPAANLPLRDFTFETEIGKLFLREMAITNLMAKTKIDGGKVNVNPFQLALNGAPVSAKLALDLSLPGYQYDANFTAESVPLGPLVDSFQPARRGQIGGTVTALAQVKGRGVTGASLQKNLSGQFDIASTNLNLQVVNVKSSVMKSLLNVIIGIPDLIRNPTAQLGRFLGSLTGSGSPASGGWVDEVSKSPIDTVSVRGKVGGGKVELERAAVQSAAFQAGARGTVTLESVLTNSSLQLPIEVSLRRGLAERVGLAGNTPANADYAKLPDFVTMTGTVGNPRQDIKYGVLASVALRAGTGIIGNTGGAAAGKITGVIGSLFGGGTRAAGATTNAGTTPVTPASSGTPPRTTTPK